MGKSISLKQMYRVFYYGLIYLINLYYSLVLVYNDRKNGKFKVVVVAAFAHDGTISLNHPSFSPLKLKQAIPIPR